MQFVRYLDGATPTWGVKTEGSIHGLVGSNLGEPDWGDLMNPSYLNKVRQSVAMDALATADAGAVTYLTPIASPGKIVCVGLNYHDHAEEQDEDIPEQPLLFAKAPTSVTNPGAPIIHPPDIDQVDYEVELAVVMGRTAHRVAARDAREYIAGYTVHNDISARDAQFSDGQWFRGKSYDTFAPFGPTLVPDADIDPNNLDLSLRVNGVVKQDSSTAEFIFDVDELVEYISQAMTLRPGDVISTGTPGGVGIFRDPPDLLAPGDHIEAEIESIGVLRNPVTAG